MRLKSSGKTEFIPGIFKKGVSKGHSLFFNTYLFVFRVRKRLERFCGLADGADKWVGGSGDLFPFGIA